MCIRDRDYTHPVLEKIGQDKMILLTAHRRENLGEPMRNMFKAIKRILEEFEGIQVVYPVHLNPIVRGIANEVLGENEKVHLIEPLDVYKRQVFISARSLGQINVHVLMEKLGGGGHIDIAGAQLKNVTLNQAYKQVHQIIEEYLEEENQ